MTFSPEENLQQSQLYGDQAIPLGLRQLGDKLGKVVGIAAGVDALAVAEAAAAAAWVASAAAAQRLRSPRPIRSASAYASWLASHR